MYQVILFALGASAKKQVVERWGANLHETLASAYEDLFGGIAADGMSNIDYLRDSDAEARVPPHRESTCEGCQPIPLHLLEDRHFGPAVGDLFILFGTTKTPQPEGFVRRVEKAA